VSKSAAWALCVPPTSRPCARLRGDLACFVQCRLSQQTIRAGRFILVTLPPFHVLALCRVVLGFRWSSRAGFSAFWSCNQRRHQNICELEDWACLFAPTAGMMVTRPKSCFSGLCGDPALSQREISVWYERYPTVWCRAIACIVEFLS